MHKAHYINGSTLGKYLYKKYSNLLTKVKKSAKKIYFYCKIEEYKHNPKKTWDVLRSLLPSKPVSHVPNTIVVEDNNISDPNIMVDKFNVHFANIGKVLATRLNCTNNNVFLCNLKSPCLFSAYLYPNHLKKLLN